MKAAVLHRANQPLQIEDIPIPTLTEGHTLLRVLACGVCRTDLHIFEGDLPLIHQPLILGHQIVGEVIEGATPDLPAGTRVGVSWIGGTDGTCPFCRRHEENLCDNPTFTGYSVNGGYAEYALVRSDFTFPLPETLDDTHVAPLLCAGIIGFRSLRVAGTQPGERVGLFGFGASASQAIAVLRHWNCEVLRLHPRRKPPPASRCRRRNLGRQRKRQASRRNSTAPSPSPPAEPSSSPLSGAFAKAESSPSTPSTSTRCPPSTTTRSSGASARSAA